VIELIKHKGIIVNIEPDSLAEEIGLEIGDKIVEINGQNLRDIIDLSFALAEEEIELLVEKKNGEQEVIEFDKEYDEKLGAEFESAVFDGIRCCGNRCWFCFVDQIAPNMRASLSVKDDDYRMSFLYGNFVTLTNTKAEDFARIKKLHLTPLFVSVHTTNGPLRAKMLQNKRAADIMQQLKHLEEADVEFHTQIVLCPGINDGEELEKTIHDLMQMQPYAQTLAIVPVGLTKYRENCYPLVMFSQEEASRVIDQVERWQKISRDKMGTSFVYLGDEFYFLAKREIPPTKEYDGFPQLENGIGLTRNFISEWDEITDNVCNPYAKQIYLDIVCGKSAGLVLTALIDQLDIPNLSVRVVAIENEFFGKEITVTGLLTGQDILRNLKDHQGKRTGVIIPGSALRTGEDVFLDDYSLADLQRDLGVDVKVAYNGGELKRLLQSWHEHPMTLDVNPNVYTWQSNAAYSKNK